MELELAENDIAVQSISHYASKIPRPPECVLIILVISQIA